MIPTLDENLRQAITEHGGAPLYVLDATTNASYVLLSAERFERMEALLGENEVADMYPLLAELNPEDWEDVGNYDIAQS